MYNHGGGGGNTPVLVAAAALALLGAALTACSGATIDPNELPRLDAWQICGDLCDSDFWSGATAADVRDELADGGGAVTQLTDDRFRNTPLHFAAAAGAPSAIRVLLDFGAEVNARNELRSTPLHWAARSGNASAIETLAEAGGSLNATDAWGQTSLHDAVDQGSSAAVDALIEAGANTNIADRNGFTPLHIALANDASDEAVAALLDAGASVAARDSGGWTPLLWAMDRAAPLAVVQALLDAGASASAAGDDRTTALHLFASSVGRRGLVEARDLFEALMDAGAPLNATDGDGWTPLMRAVAVDALTQIIEDLLAADADVGIADDEGLTALHLAARQGDLIVVQELLKAGADPLSTTDRGRTALHLAAAFGGGAAVLAALLDADTPIDAPDEDGATPLHLAIAACRSEDALFALIDSGADVDAPDNDGRTPLHIAAAECNALDPYIVLLQSEAQRRPTDNDGDTPLNVAQDAGRRAIVIALLRRGLNARPPAPDLAGIQPRCISADLGLLLDADNRSGRWSSGDCLSSDRDEGWADSYEDLYSFELLSDAYVEIGLSSQDVDSYLGLLGANGRVIETDDDGGSGSGDSRIRARLTAGRYWIAATHYGERSEGAYQLAVSVEY